MKNLIYSFVKKRAHIEVKIKEETVIVEKLIDFLIKLSGQPNTEKDIVTILELEAEMADHYSLFLQSIDKKQYLPFYWEEIYDLYMDIKKIFNFLILYFNKRNVLEDTEIFNAFLNTQKGVMKNIVLFFDEYISNRKYVRELLKNNNTIIKTLSKMHLKIIGNTIFESRDSLLKYRIIEILESISTIDYTIQDLLNKILLTSGI
ncbi:MAG: hypothetical protein J7K04_11385 [Spirochaetales bacterium]|nr:hypothetical protein [Spirochaetales bacterium]